jgi:hypothetical protein
MVRQHTIACSRTLQSYSLRPSPAKCQTEALRPFLMLCLESTTLSGIRVYLALSQFYVAFGYRCLHSFGLISRRVMFYLLVL